MDGIFGDRTKSALTRLSTTKAEDLYPANRITNHNRELISRALDISSRITDTLYPSIPLGLVQRQLNEAGFRDVNGELLVEDGIFGEQMEGALRGYGGLSEYFSGNNNDELNAEKNSYISQSNRISPDTAIIKALPNPPPRGDSFDPVTDIADYMYRLPEREKNVFTAVLKHGENNDDEDLIKVAKILNGEDIGTWDGAKITIHVEQLKVKEEKYSKAKGVTGIASLGHPAFAILNILSAFAEEEESDISSEIASYAIQEYIDNNPDELSSKQLKAIKYADFIITTMQSLDDFNYTSQNQNYEVVVSKDYENAVQNIVYLVTPDGKVTETDRYGVSVPKSGLSRYTEDTAPLKFTTDSYVDNERYYLKGYFRFD